MRTQVGKTQENQNQTVINEGSQTQRSTFQFEDGRPEASQMAKLQGMANSTPQANKLAQLQSIANNSGPLKRGANGTNHNPTPQTNQPVQKKKNNSSVSYPVIQRKETDTFSYTIVKGDTFAVLAKRFLGSADEWKKIDEVYSPVDFFFDTGHKKDDALDKGKVIKIPTSYLLSKIPDIPKLAPPPSATPTDHYKTKSGDTFKKIATSKVGDESKAAEIYALNNHIPESELFTDLLVFDNLNANLKPSITLKVPLANKSQPGSYKVIAGDTLGIIAKHHLGDEKKWSLIPINNKDKQLYPSSATVPSKDVKLKVNVVLRIPDKTSGFAEPKSTEPIAELESFEQGAFALKSLIDAVEKVLSGAGLAEEEKKKAATTLSKLDDKNFAMVLNFLKTMGWMDTLLGNLKTADKNTVIDRAETTIKINTTIFHGVPHATVLEDIHTANKIYNPHKISVEVGKLATLDEVQTKAVMGGADTLDIGEFNGGPGSAEKDWWTGHQVPGEQARNLLNTNRTGGFLTAYWVKDFKNFAGLRGIALAKFAVSLMEEGVVVSITSRASDTFAHELGHILTQKGHVDIDDSALVDDNLMQDGTNRNVGVDQVTDKQKRTIKTSLYMQFRG